MVRFHRRGSSYGTVCALLIFALFAVLSLVIVTAAISSFRQASVAAENDSELRGALSYITGKLRNASSSKDITIGEINGTKVFSVATELDGEKYQNRLYVYNGALLEQLTVYDQKPDLKNGSFITSIKSVDIKEEKSGLYKISAETKDGIKKETSVSLEQAQKGETDDKKD